MTWAVPIAFPLKYGVWFDLDGSITPAENIEIEIFIPKGKKVKKVSFSRELSVMDPVSYEEDGGIIRFQVPKVNIYGMALVEF